MPEIRASAQRDGTPTLVNPATIVAATILRPEVSGLLTQPGNAVGDALAIKAAKGANADITSLSGTAAAPGIDFLASSTTVASATTVDLGVPTTRKVQITGTASILSFGTQPHRERLIHFSGACTLVHNATSLILPGGANIITAAGDTAVATSDASGAWRVRDYTRASGKPIVGPAAADITDAGATGRTVLTGTAAAGATALGLGSGNAPSFAGVAATGQISSTLASGGSTSAFLVSSVAPSYAWKVTDQGADGKTWDARAIGGMLAFRTVNDANAEAATWMAVSRGSGITVSSVTFGAPVVVPSLSTAGTIRIGSYTVATLPTAGIAGRVAWASNGRAYNGAGTLQGAGAGTGVLVTDDGSAWRVAGTNQTVQA